MLAAGLCALFPFIANADPPASAWSVHVWQSDDGLPNNNVTGLAETQDGYLWMATPARLARFDGVSFETISRETFARGYTERTSVLLASTDGGLWLGMDHGPIFYVKSGVAHVLTNGLPDRIQIVQTLTEDGEGGLWITYRGGTIYRLKDGHFRQFTSADGLPDWSACSFARDKDGCLWFAKGGEVGQFRDGRFDSLVHVTHVATQIRLAPARNGGVWICAGGQLSRFKQGGKLKHLGTFKPDQPAAEPTMLLEDHNGDVWIGTSTSGLFHYDGVDFDRIATSHGAITSLVEDREGNIWAGTAGGGLNRIVPRAVNLETTESGLPFPGVQSICEDSHGAVWATTQDGLLIRHGDGGWNIVSTNTDWPGGTPMCVAADHAGGVWIGTHSRALYYWRDGRYAGYRAAEGLVAHMIHALLVSSNGDLWIGGNAPESLQRLRGATFTNFKLPDDVKVIRAMTEDAGGNIWIGTSKGVLLRVAGGAVVDETPHMGGERSIRCLSGTADGSLWIGHAGQGLTRLRDGRAVRFGTEQGLYDDYICEAAADDRGWLWLGADHGIFKVRLQEMEDVADGRAARVRSVHYGRSEGLPSLQANFGNSPGMLRARDGRLWFPMSTALAVIDSSKLREDFQPSPVLLKRVTVDDEIVADYGGVMPSSAGLNLDSARPGLRLPPGHRRLEFEFTTLSFGAPENVRFQYRLGGFDEHWMEAGPDRVASYSRLPAGDYRFQVRGCNSAGIWNDRGATLDFIVEPFVWQTWWFRLGLMAIFTVAIVAVVRYLSFRRLQSRVRALEQQAALDKERARIARDIHDDVGNRLTKITLLSGLALRDNSDPARAGQHVQQISSTVRQVTDSLDEIVWAVNPRNDTLPHLVNYIGQFAIDFLGAAGLQAKVDLPDHPPERMVSADVRHNLFLAVKESLNNVVRHAHASEASLTVEVKGKALALIVQDNGRGFESAPANGCADGLRNIRQRMAEIDGGCEIQSAPGAGTRISLLYTWPERK
jgi:ligand-binding sensor domain-containing protein/signal transduction histidine kinase